MCTAVFMGPQASMCAATVGREGAPTACTPESWPWIPTSPEGHWQTQGHIHSSSSTDNDNQAFWRTRQREEHSAAAESSQMSCPELPGSLQGACPPWEQAGEVYRGRRGHGRSSGGPEPNHSKIPNRRGCGGRDRGHWPLRPSSARSGPVGRRGGTPFWPPQSSGPNSYRNDYIQATQGQGEKAWGGLTPAWCYHQPAGGPGPGPSLSRPCDG